MEFKIRKALLDDAYNRAVCHVSSWQSAYKGIVPDEILNNLSAEKIAEKFKAELERNEYSYYCAEYANEVVGHFNIGKCREDDKLDAGELRGIYLIEKLWGKGHGKEMMEYALNLLKKTGYDEVILWVLEDNNRARKFYEKCGFIFDGAKKEILIGKSLIEIRYVIKL